MSYTILSLANLDVSFLATCKMSNHLKFQSTVCVAYPLRLPSEGKTAWDETAGLERKEYAANFAEWRPSIR